MTTQTTTRRDLLTTAATLTGVAALPGCGLLLHPERQGNAAGRVDPLVVVLDGVLCLAFLVPGIVAFAVDLATGCIYYGGTMAPEATTKKERRMHRRWLRKNVRRKDIDVFLKEDAGLPSGLDTEGLRVLADGSRLDADRLDALVHDPEGTEPLGNWDLLEDADGELVGFLKVA